MREKNGFRKAERFKDIKEIIYNSAKLYGDKIAFTTKVKNGENIEYIDHTYTDLLDDINSFGTALYGMDLEDSRIAVIGVNCYKWAVAHLSNLLGGIVSVPLDKGLQQEELEDSLIRSEAKAIVFDAKLTEMISKIKENGKTKIERYICMDATDEFTSFDKLLVEGKKKRENGENKYENHNVDAKKMSILLFTSGTTSKSKAVMLNQYGIATNVYDMQLVETFFDTDVNIAFLPYHHIFGSTGMLVMLACGVKTVFPDGLKYIKQNLIEYKVSIFIGVPILIDKMYQTIIKEVEKQGKTKILNFGIKLCNAFSKLHIDIRKLVFKEILNQLGGGMRTIISGGAPLDKKTAKWFNDIGIHLVQGYGLTETSPVIAAENDYYLRAGSVGIPMRNTEVCIDNKDDNGIGEIIVKGPNVMLGYYNDEEKTKEVIRDGWFHTGDLGYIDNDGFLFITGRIKDMMVLKNGKKVFPEELEVLVNRIEEVEESFVYGLPSEEDANDIKVAVKIVYNDKAKGISENELREIIWNKIKQINKTLPKYKYIKDMILTTSPLIKTTTNKIKRTEELNKILEGRMQAV